MKQIWLLLLPLSLASCGLPLLNGTTGAYEKEPQMTVTTNSQKLLLELPAAAQKVPVTVYGFEDQTGQLKPNEAFNDFSRAVTQGGVAILYETLLKAGRGNWFTVIERGGLENLLQERKIIRDTRGQFAGADGEELPPVGPLLYAGLLLEGGIVAYESNIITGGAGTRYLGIGASTEYRRDIVTVYLRAVNVQTGEVLASVSTSKTIYSIMLQSGIFKYVSVDKLLEAEAGFSLNEPPQMAVRQAIELAVYSLIMEGSMKGLWGFSDEQMQAKMIGEYQSRYYNIAPATQTESPDMVETVPVPDIDPVTSTPTPEQMKQMRMNARRPVQQPLVPAPQTPPALQLPPANGPATRYRPQRLPGYRADTIYQESSRPLNNYDPSLDPNAAFRRRSPQ